MNLRSPIAAMLWEQWRLTRVEAGQRLGVGLAAASAALLFKLGNDNFANSQTIALWILIISHAFFWFSIAKLNGGRFMDGYKPGFPLYLLHTRPVPTTVVVGVSMAYDALSCAVLYVLSAAALGLAFGISFPLFPVVACIVAYHLASTCIQWSTRNRIVQWVGSIAIFWPLVALLRNNMSSPLVVDFSVGDYILLALVCVASYGLTVVGVARQRRGDAVATEPRLDGWSGYPLWLVNLFRFACPTTSATRAQLWFELRSSGLPVLTIGLGVAVLIFLLFVIGIVYAPIRGAALFIAMFSAPFVVFLFGSNAFGIRSRQGRLYASSFDATQPCGTAQMAGLKVLVRTACVLAALTVMGVSVWASSSLMAAWGEWNVNGEPVTSGLLYRRSQVMSFLATQPEYALAAMAVIASIGIATIVAWQAAREALKVRYPRGVLVAQWSPAAWGITMGLLGLAGQFGILPHAVARAGVMTCMAIATLVLVSAPIYFLWKTLKDRALTIGYAGGAFVMLAAFGLAYWNLLRAVGEPHAGTHWTAMLLLSWPILLLLVSGAIAPWALGRVRHT